MISKITHTTIRNVQTSQRPPAPRQPGAAYRRGPPPPCARSPVPASLPALYTVGCGLRSTVDLRTIRTSALVRPRPRLPAHGQQRLAVLSVSVGTILRQNALPGEPFQHLRGVPSSRRTDAVAPTSYELSSDTIADQDRYWKNPDPGTAMWRDSTA